MQLSFDGQELDQISIARLREFEPPEGYWLAFSGGKDSIVILDLAQRAGVKFEAHYNITGADPPELVQFIKQHHPTVSRDMPRETLWRLVARKGLPIRQGRWCCAELKERGGQGRIVATGIRWAESPRRARRHLVEFCTTGKGRRYLHPIIDWSTEELWGYIRDRQLPYCSLYDEGFQRLGCVLCPMNDHGKQEAIRWPKIAQAWERAATKYWERQTPGGQRFASGSEFFHWWLANKARVSPQQRTYFD